MRVFFSSIYYEKLLDKNEYILLSSGKGNEEYVERYKRENDSSKVVIGIIHLSGYWLKPIYK
jgi:hypothetical protein